MIKHYIKIGIYSIIIMSVGIGAPVLYHTQKENNNKKNNL
jgi:hypothetical protein